MSINEMDLLTEHDRLQMEIEKHEKQPSQPKRQRHTSSPCTTLTAASVVDDANISNGTREYKKWFASSVEELEVKLGRRISHNFVLEARVYARRVRQEWSWGTLRKFAGRENVQYRVRMQYLPNCIGCFSTFHLVC